MRHGVVVIFRHSSRSSVCRGKTCRSILVHSRMLSMQQFRCLRSGIRRLLTLCNTLESPKNRYHQFDDIKLKQKPNLMSVFSLKVAPVTDDPWDSNRAPMLPGAEATLMRNVDCIS